MNRVEEAVNCFKMNKSINCTDLLGFHLGNPEEYMKAKDKSRANEVCSREEMDLLGKAFFSKKKYFDYIHMSAC